MKKEFRFIHMADLHLDNGMPYAKLNTKTGLSNRFEKQLSIVEKVFNYAIAKKIDCVIISGDITHLPNPISRVRVKFSGLLQKYKDCLSIICCGGNHDKSNNWFSFQDYSTYIENNAFIFAYKPMLINNKWENINLYLSPWGEQLKEEKLDKNKINILVTHQDIKGADYGNGYISEKGITVKTLKELKYDYIALGHYHRKQKLADNIYFSGSPYPRDFKETNQKKYVLDVSITKDNSNLDIRVKPIVTCPPIFQNLYVDEISKLNDTDIKDYIIKLIKEKHNNYDKTIKLINKLYKKGVSEVILIEKKESKSVEHIDYEDNLNMSIEQFINHFIDDNIAEEGKEIYKMAIDILDEVRREG